MFEQIVPVGKHGHQEISFGTRTPLSKLIRRAGQFLAQMGELKQTFLPLLSDPADVDLGHITFEERMASSHLVDPQGRVYSRGEGILKLASLLPLTAPFVFLFRLLPKHQVIADKLYGLVSSHRGVPYGGSCKVDFSESAEQ